ncbi:Uncharacterised protein [Mycoplasmopsis maculosa]|uniref:Lipoprotein-associated type-17 domain-containing protein n=1 Tax=Mycoplasmopsis maculosa TaxID=114885 RepID=A0A449B3Z3_9BACT|nr:lipoprotein 17-related variable surface protein [Mycoplasmopsis maculosa]VEU75321.1 Uncharacterised protein [Mycoplasmopsis maculosa]
MKKNKNILHLLKKTSILTGVLSLPIFLSASCTNNEEKPKSKVNEGNTSSSKSNENVGNHSTPSIIKIDDINDRHEENNEEIEGITIDEWIRNTIIPNTTVSLSKKIIDNKKALLPSSIDEKNFRIKIKDVTNADLKLNGIHRSKKVIYNDKNGSIIVKVIYTIDEDNYEKDFLFEGFKINKKASSNNELENSNSEKPKPDKPNKPSRSNNETNDISESVSSNAERIRLASWNVLNFGDGTLKNDFKVETLSSIIDKQGYDVVGLMELDDESAAPAIANWLNKKQKNANWKVVQSDRKLTNSNKNSAEYAAFIYKSNLLEISGFKNSNEQWLAYDDTGWVNYEGSKEKYRGYSRPPFGVKFKTKTKIKNDFTFVVSHLDSPGAAKDEEKSKLLKYAQGAQESNEAANLHNVMNWFDKKDGQNDDLFFMGDTNIKFKNSDKAFENLNINGYKTIFDERKEFFSSLNTKNGYANPYDKLFAKTNLIVTNPKVYALDRVTTDGTLKHLNISNLSQFVEWAKRTTGKSYSSQWAAIRSISDHNPISVDIILNSNDTN